MSQKGLAGVLIVVLVIVLMFAAFVYVLVVSDRISNNQLFVANLQPLTPSLMHSGCTKISESVIKQKNLTKIVSCTEKEFIVNGQKVYFVHIGYGEPMDCPSGCIQPNYAAIVEKDKIIDYGSLREDFLDVAINTKTSKLCNSKQPYELTLIKDDREQYKWKISFNNEESMLCRLSGYATVDGGSETFDLTNLKTEVQELDCNNPGTLEEICSKIPDVAYNCGIDEKKKEACLYLKGISQGINCGDNIVARRKCVEVHGDSSGKCDDEMTNKNYCFRSKAEVEGDLEVCDLITNDVDLLDGCYARLAITLKDSSICLKRELSDFWRQVCY